MQNPITLRDIENLKKLAKQAKALHPGLSHAQRLNLMAQHHLQARSYHEVRKWVARSLEQHYERKDGGVVYCKLCRFSFVPDVAEDSTTHEKRHLNFEDALFSLGALPAAHATREQIAVMNLAIATKQALRCGCNRHCGSATKLPRFLPTLTALQYLIRSRT